MSEDGGAWRKRTLLGLKWGSLNQVFKISGQFVAMALLARLLSPEDFGRMSMLLVYSGIFTILAEGGWNHALIYYRDAREVYFRTVFTLQMIQALVLYGLFALLAPLFAAGYDAPELTPFFRGVGLVLILKTLGSVAQARLRRELRFEKIALAESGAIFVAGLTAVLLAWRGAGLWALVVQHLIQFGFASIVYIILTRSWFRPALRRVHLAEMKKYAFSMVGNHLTTHARNNVDYLLIGLYLGEQVLGYYTLAFKIMVYPLQNITQIINQVMMPAMSQIQNQLEKIRTAYLNLVNWQSLLIFPVLGGLAAVAEPMIRLVFGLEWLPAVPLIQILCVAGTISILLSTTGPLFQSTGNPHWELVFQGLVLLPSLALAVWIGVQYNIEVTVLAFTIRAWLVSLLVLAFAGKLAGLSLKQIMARPLWHLLITAIMAGLAWWPASPSALELWAAFSREHELMGFFEPAAISGANPTWKGWTFILTGQILTGVLVFVLLVWTLNPMGARDKVLTRWRRKESAP